MIAAPGIVGWMNEELDPAQIGACFSEVFNGKSLHCLINHVDAHVFTHCYFFNELAVIRINTFNFTGP